MLPELKQYVIRLFDAEFSKEMEYHNLSHTLDVVEAAERYCFLEKVNNEDRQLILSAAYLHDIGFKIQYKDNEGAAIQMAQDILPKMGYSYDQITIISDCIAATALPQTAKTIHQKILCDADLDYLGREDYYQISSKLFKEWINFGLLIESQNIWQQVQLNFLTSHQYYTHSAQILRNKNKELRIKELSNNIKTINKS